MIILAHYLGDMNRQPSPALLRKFEAYWQYGHEASFDKEELVLLEEYFYNQGEIDKLFRLLELAMALYPDSAYFMIHYAQLLMESERHDEAKRVIHYLMLEYPRHFYVQLLNMFYMLDEGRYDELSRALDDLLKNFAPLDSEQAELLFDFVKWIYEDEFATRKWLYKIFQASAKTPEDIRHFLFSMDDASAFTEDMEPLFLEAMQHLIYDVPLHLLYVKHLKQFGKSLARAREFLEVVLLLEPDNATAHLYMAELLEEQGQFDRAIIHYNHVLALNDPSASIYMRMGVCHEKAGRPSDARQYYKLAVEEDPAFLPAWHALIQLALNQDDIDRALSYNLDAIDKIPNRKLYESLGYLFLQKEFYPSALKAYEEAYNLGSRDKNILLVLHDLYEKNGEYHRARQVIEDAHWHYPGDKDIESRRKKYYSW